MSSISYHYAMGAAREGHDVHVFTTNVSPQLAYLCKAEVTVHQLPKLFQNDGGGPHQSPLPALSDFDIVHVHAPCSFNEARFALRARQETTRYVVTYHQDPIACGGSRLLAGVNHFCLGKRLLARAKCLLVTSLSLTNTARLAPFARREPGRIVELPTGVDIDHFHPALNPGRLRYFYGFGRRDRLMLMAGALDRPPQISGFRTLLRSLQAIPDRRLQLFVLGDGRFRGKHQALAEKLGLEGRVIFRGWVSHDLLPKHYAMCDFVVLPFTTVVATLHTALLEAMACARPVIVSDLPGINSIVNNGQDGLLTRPTDVADLTEKIRHLLDHNSGSSLGECGRAKVTAHYSWSKIIPQLLQTYEQVLAS